MVGEELEGGMRDVGGWNGDCKGRWREWCRGWLCVKYLRKGWVEGGMDGWVN